MNAVFHGGNDLVVEADVLRWLGRWQCPDTSGGRRARASRFSHRTPWPRTKPRCSNCSPPTPVPRPPADRGVWGRGAAPPLRSRNRNRRRGLSVAGSRSGARVEKEVKLKVFA
jgi:hypothetical protein